MEIITEDFTYNVPDSYLSTATTEGKTNTLTYTGPNEIWAFVDKVSGKLDWSMHALINFDEGMQEIAITHAGQYHKPILVHFDQNPLICWAMYGDLDWDSLGEKTFTLDGETEPYYRHPDPLPPQLIYDYPSFVYLFDSSTWKQPYPMQTPKQTQDDVEGYIAAYIADIEKHIADSNSGLTADQKTTMTAAKTTAEGIVAKYGPDGANVPYWMWPPCPPTPDWDPNMEEDTDVPEAERWDSAADGSEGAGAETNYQPENNEPTPASESEAFPNTDSQQTEAGELPDEDAPTE